MTIHEDAQQGKLTHDALTRYLRTNPGVLNECDLATGLAPLATAAVAGFADEVEHLLREGAKADALSRNGETALLLITRSKSARNRPRIVQLLLSKTPAGSLGWVDFTTAAQDNNTPLMFAVLNEDIDTIKLLVNAGASLTAKNDKGLTAKDMAASNKAVALALDPAKKERAFAKLTGLIISFLLYIVAWINKTTNGVLSRLFGLAPKLNDDIDDVSYSVYRCR